MSGLNEKPAGSHGFVCVRNGHLYEGANRLRLFGVNLAFGASFPAHADAEKIAARMAKFGINCVRFHHMDNQAAPGGIWSADMRTLDPGQLDKLDYFISQLKRNGIYADLNLHVSRNYPGMPNWEGMPGYFKGVDNFYPPMIAMQREYARQLLTHVNPYTMTAYVDEPAVAIIEVNNENGLIGEWSSGSLDNMTAVYCDSLQARWNEWLARKYSSQAILERAWNASSEPLGTEILKDGDFENVGGSAWRLEQLFGAQASALRDDGGARINVLRTDGVGWHVQLTQDGIAYSNGRHYTITFRARSDAPRRIEVVASQSHAPWSSLWSASADITPDWKDYSFTFRPAAGEPDGRIVFSGLGNGQGRCWIGNASLRPGGDYGLKSGERLGALPIFKKRDARTDRAERDWMSFLYDTEADYWLGMERFLKNDLHAHSLVVGSATGFSPASIQAQLDVVDGHAYWHHPRFPGKPWDPVDWTVTNVSMAGEPSGGTLPELAGRRVAGKPYICTEYDAPAPNTHASEAFLLLAAYAALQDWDGLFLFAYCHRTNDWDTQRLTSFFDIDQDPGKLVTLPAAVSMFRGEYISAAAKKVTFPVTSDGAIDECLLAGPWWGMETFGMGKMLPLESEVQLDLSGRAAVPGISSEKLDPVTISDTGELAWDTEKRRVLVNSPRTRAYIGRITGGAVQLGDISVEPGGNRQDWAAITVTDMGWNTGGRELLITATGYIQNTGMQWKSSSEESVGRDWGVAPTLLEGIPAAITLPASASKVEAWTLDGRGQRKTPVGVSRMGRGTLIEIGPRYETLWYEVLVR